MIYERLLRPLLFKLEPERAHALVTALLEAVQAAPLGTRALRLAYGRREPGLRTTVFGLDFPNPIGIAAGFDKDCRLAPALAALGFGFVELGSVTLAPQPGNPKPRVFRLPEHRALINRLGFNSAGAEAAARALAAGRPEIPIGLNLGLNAGVSREDAPSRYAETFALLEPHGDYFAVNLSSPNTTGLRDLLEATTLARILEAIEKRNARRKPVLVKLSPDGDDSLLPAVLDVVARLAAGVIVCNTTISRAGLPEDYGERRGGLSGAPLRALSTELIRKVRALTAGGLPIVGVGGVFDGADALEKLRAGASLVQVYTGFVYGGPATPSRIQKQLARLLAETGFPSVAAAVGTEAEARA